MDLVRTVRRGPVQPAGGVVAGAQGAVAPFESDRRAPAPPARPRRRRTAGRSACAYSAVSVRLASGMTSSRVARLPVAPAGELRHAVAGDRGSAQRDAGARRDLAVARGTPLTVTGLGGRGGDGQRPQLRQGHEDLLGADAEAVGGARGDLQAGVVAVVLERDVVAGPGGRRPRVVVAVAAAAVDQDDAPGHRQRAVLVDRRRARAGPAPRRRSARWPVARSA